MKVHASKIKAFGDMRNPAYRLSVFSGEFEEYYVWRMKRMGSTSSWGVRKVGETELLFSMMIPRTKDIKYALIEAVSVVSIDRGWPVDVELELM